jgi:hypothetical protein
MYDIGMSPAPRRSQDETAALRLMPTDPNPLDAGPTGIARPLSERMVYNRDHPAGQMTVASVPDDTIPLLACCPLLACIEGAGSSLSRSGGYWPLKPVTLIWMRPAATSASSSLRTK